MSVLFLNRLSDATDLYCIGNVRSVKCLFTCPPANWTPRCYLLFTCKQQGFHIIGWCRQCHLWSVQVGGIREIMSKINISKP